MALVSQKYGKPEWDKWIDYYNPTSASGYLGKVGKQQLGGMSGSDVASKYGFDPTQTVTAFANKGANAALVQDQHAYYKSVTEPQQQAAQQAVAQAKATGSKRGYFGGQGAGLQGVSRIPAGSSGAPGLPSPEVSQPAVAPGLQPPPSLALTGPSGGKGFQGVTRQGLGSRMRQGRGSY